MFLCGTSILNNSWFAKLEYHKFDEVRVIFEGEDGLSFLMNGSFQILGSIYIVGDAGFR